MSLAQRDFSPHIYQATSFFCFLGFLFGFYVKILKIFTLPKKCTDNIQCFGGMLENLLIKDHILALKSVVLLTYSV